MEHICAQCPSHRHEFDLSLFNKLPAELKIKIISLAIVPQQPCIRHVFGQCTLDPWSCNDGAHPGIREGSEVTSKAPPIPCPFVTGQDAFFRIEGFRAFFRNNVFVFDYEWTGKNLSDVCYAQGMVWPPLFVVGAHARDPVAARLLKFVDEDDVRREQWSIAYETLFCNEPQYHPSLLPIEETDRYRCEIRHLVIKVCIPTGAMFFVDWHWPLKVDWATLPNLKTLCLDLRSYSRHLESPDYNHQDDHQRIVDGAKRMECLGLTSLIIYGLCSGPTLCHDEQHKQKMDTLFRKALSRDGVLEFRDIELKEW